MKKLLILLVVALIATTGYAQKDELKMAQKAMDSNNYSEAISALSKIESTIDAAKLKYKVQYYFLAGKANYANGTTPDNFEKASKAFNKVLDLEKKGTQKYTNEVSQLLNAMIQKVATDANKDYNDARAFNKEKETKEKSLKLFTNAGDGFKQVYVLSKTDTAFLQNAGLAYYFAEKYKKSVQTYQDLLDTGYTGAKTEFIATNTVNEKKVSYLSKEDMDKQVKLKLATDPEVKVTKSQRNELIKMIAKNYIALKDNEKALAAILEAKKATPDDYGLLVDEANIYYAMGDNVKFKEKLEEAVKINPTDETLHYNIGVMKMELNDNAGAIESFKKAIALKPDYADAYNNIGATILLKAEAIVEEMNNSLSDFDKYDKLQAQQFEVYKEALPYYEKAYEFNKTNKSTVQTLLGIYENLEMTDKLKEMKAVYEEMKN